MEKTVQRILKAGNQLKMQNLMTKQGLSPKQIAEAMVASDLQKQGNTFYPGEQFGFTQNEVKNMLQNGIKSKGFSSTLAINASYEIPIDLTGIANIMLGLALGFPDQFQNYSVYPNTFNFEVNNQQIIMDLHPMFLDVTAIFEPYFEYVYLLSGKDTLNAFGQNGGTSQRMVINVYYI